jgi:hypothetical protein
MVFNFSSIAVGKKYEIQIFFVASSEKEAMRLGEQLANSHHRIAVDWVPADLQAAEAVKQAMVAQQSWTPTAIILDYESYGEEMWGILRSLRSAIGDRYVEIVVFDLPIEQLERSDLKAANITVVQALSQFSLGSIDDSLRRQSELPSCAN